MSSNPILPNNVAEDILLRLPAKSLSRFKCVCKHWCDFINNLDFVENEKYLHLMFTSGHQIYSSVDYFDSSSPLPFNDKTIEINYPFKRLEPRRGDSVRIRGSCNGLVCIETPCPYSYDDKLISLWNPSTTEFKDIPKPPPCFDGFRFHGGLDASINTRFLDDSFEDIDYGFGYDCNVKDYKLVRIAAYGAYRNCESNERIYLSCQVKVYTLGSNSWKHVPLITFPYKMGYDNGVHVNGVLHWIATPWTRGIRASKDVVVSFNFEDERLTDVSPLEHFGKELFISSVGNLGGCLCVFVEDWHRYSIEVWVMKDYGVRESWTKQFTIARQSLGRFSSNDLTPIRFFKNGKILLSIRSRIYYNYEYALVLYDPKHKSALTLTDHSGDRSVSQTYTESLVSLNTGTYVSQRTPGRIKKKINNENKPSLNVSTQPSGSRFSCLSEQEC